MSRLFVLIAVACVACVDASGIAASWEGHRIDDLIFKWGPPSSVYDFSDGRQTVSFSHARLVSGTTYECTATFGSNAAGIIETSKIDGNIGGCNRMFQDKPKP